jgi:hypothetical protein
MRKLLQHHLSHKQRRAHGGAMNHTLGASMGVGALLVIMSSVLGVSYEGSKKCSVTVWTIVFARTAVLLLEAVSIVIFLQFDNLRFNFVKHHCAVSMVMRLAFVGALLMFIQGASTCRTGNARAIFILGIVIIAIDALSCLCGIVAAVLPRPSASENTTEIVVCN